MSRRARLRAYLTANAADKVHDKGAQVLLEQLDPAKTPARITQTPLIVKRHIIVREVVKINANVKARSITNCDSCHHTAAQGSFALDDLIVPGLSKVVRPGARF